MSGQDDNTAGFSVNTFAAYNKDDVETTEGLRGQLDDHFDSKGGYFNDNDYLFEQIGDYETVEIGGIDFEKGTYKYNYGSEPTTVESYYVGYLPGKELQVYITTRYTDKENLEYISTLLDNIEITDEQLYSQLVDSSVLGTSNVSINPATILGQASTVRIYNQECNDYTFSGALSGLNVAGQTYTICSAGLGSGFVINSSGYIVTNSHVADPNDLKILYSGLSDDGIYESAILADLSYRLDLEYGPGFSYQLSNEDLFGYYVMFLYSLYDGGYVSASLNHRDLYVQGNEPFSFDDNTGALLNPLNHYKSDLVNSNKISSQADVYFNEEGSYTDVPDIAIIKTEETLNIPSIPLQYQGLVTGQKIYVIGYPGLVDNEKFIDTSNIFSSTVTQGTISAIKANSNNTFDLLQIDASVEHGNSGGPIVSDDGAVVGIATYAMASSSNGNYNAGVSGEAVEAFLKDSAVTASTNEEREVLEASLIDISNSYYSDAKEKLESLVDKQESLGVIINPFIELCDSKIAAGEDKTSVLDIDFTNWQTVIIPLMALILIVMIIILILLIGRNKKNRRVVSNPQQPAPQVQ
jgi:S1-C subfamily serine protease